MYIRNIYRFNQSFVRCYSSKAENLTVRAGMHENPGKVFFIEDQRTYTYGEFLHKTGQYVSVLNRKYGIGKGDRVLSRCAKDLDVVALYLACLRLGAIYIPANPAYTLSEISHYVKDSQPKLMVTCDEGTDQILRESIPNVVRLEQLAKESKLERPNMEVENVDENDVACVCYTSGTTGLPKGAMLTHGSLSSNAEELVQLWKFTHSDRLLHMLPFYHVHGMFISLNCSIFSHSTVLWRDKFNVEDCLKWMINSTVMMGIPTFYSRLVASNNFTHDHCHNIRLFVSGSAPLSLATWEKFKEMTSHPILERYGMTEAQVICSNPYAPDDRLPGTVGKPLKGTKLRLNESDVIEIKSNAIFRGYWNNPQKTNEEFTKDGYFITGDVAKIDKRGYVTILGRSKDLIISGGLNVYPKEIEDVLDKIDGIKESTIFGCPHMDLGEGVVAAAVPEKLPVAEETEAKLILQLKEKLAGYKVPKKIIFMESLPRNSMGKIQKRILRERFKDIFN